MVIALEQDYWLTHLQHASMALCHVADRRHMVHMVCSRETAIGGHATESQLFTLQLHWQGLDMQQVSHNFIA